MQPTAQNESSINFANTTEGKAEALEKSAEYHKTKSPSKAIDYWQQLLELAQQENNPFWQIKSLYKMGEIHRITGKMEIAMADCTRALKIAEKVDDKSGLAWSLNNIGNIHYSQGNYPLALKFHQRALRIRNGIGDKQGIGASFNNIGNIHNTQGNYSSALQSYQKSLRLKEETGDNRGVALAMNNIGIIHDRQGNYQLALELHQKALRLSEETGDKLGIALAMNNIGALQEKLGNYPLALEFYNKYLRLGEESGDKQGMATSLSNIGVIHEKEGDYQLALEFHQKALQIREEIADKHGIALSMNNIGNIHFYQGNSAFGLKFLHKSLAIREEICDKHGIANSLINIGTIHKEQANYPLALEFLNKSLNLIQELGDDASLAEPYMLIGNILTLKGNLKESTKYLLMALRISEESGAKQFKRDTLKYLSELRKVEGDYKEALEYHERYMQVKDGMSNTDISKKITELRISYDVEIQQKESDLRRLKTVELEAKNIQIEKEKEEAERQRRRAEQSERFKQMFLANMSHEIRTPMNAIVGMTNLLLSSPPSKKNLHDYLTAIKHSSDNLMVVINDVLDLSKIEAGKLRLEKTPFNLRQQLEMVHNIFALKVKEKKLTFFIHVNKQVPQILIGDPYRLNQVLINLLGNAFKFTRKGQVTLSVSRETENKYRFSVTDTGIGIVPEKLATIFESFNQAESDTTRQYGGTGLGLTISKQLVELMDGEIKVTSKEGKGSEFSFIIELNAGSVTDLPDSSKMKLKLAANDLTGIRILLAEDNRYNQIVAVEIIKKLINKPQITVAKTGKEVLQKLKTKAHDIVLMDLHMPVMDGYETTKKIRSTFHGSKKNIPILALTASVVKADIERCLSCGMNGYISKPFSPEQLLEEIYKHTRNDTGADGLSYIPTKAKTVEEDKMTNIDTGYLENITGSNPAEMVAYIDIFLKFAPAQILKIKKAVKETDNKALYTALHTIKPQLQFMGVQNVLQKSEQLEIEVREKKKVSIKMKKDALDINDKINEAMKHWGRIKEKLTLKINGGSI